MSYPVSEATVRPYRLWNANEKEPLRWRYYSDPRRAHIGALIETRFAKVGVTIEVYNATSGRLLGQYTRGVNSIKFLGA
jgi:hypothetical protein